MANTQIPAVFVRGGTSKAVVFHARDLPAEQSLRDRMFCHVLGSPDPYGRQLDGLGGGLSSLSKIVVVETSQREDADIDYTFVQVAVDSADADYGAMCGNMSSCIGPFAVDEGLYKVPADKTEAVVRVYNTNTEKLYIATFPVADGVAVEQGSFEIPGVSGSGACIRLDYIEPGGATTGALLPTGTVTDTLAVKGAGNITVSMIDASNPVVFVNAQDVGKTGAESPQELDADVNFMTMMESIRCAAAVSMGLADSPGTAGLASPKVAIVAPPLNFTALDSRHYERDRYDLAVRIVSMGNVHRAITLTGAMCTATAVKIPGTIPHQLVRHGSGVLLGNPSGLLPVEACVESGPDGFHAVSATTYRTQRRLMEGTVPVPEEWLCSSSG